MQVLIGIVSGRFHVAAKNLKGVEKQILERTGLVSMAPGTLNVTLPFDYIVHADTTIEPDEYFTGERLKLQRCRVRGHRMIIMRPDSHELPGGLGADVLELISPLHLRTDWGLQDLDELEVEVEGDQSWWERPDPTDLLSHRDPLPR
jgi:CTP-dependent riboflavin kinase